MEYRILGNRVGPEYAYWRFKQYQRSLGTPDNAIPIIWDCCHESVETRINELPDNLEMIVE